MNRICYGAVGLLWLLAAVLGPAPLQAQTGDETRNADPNGPYIHVLHPAPEAKTNSEPSLKTLSLPFFDNFTNPGIRQPDTARWFRQSTVFRNEGSALNAPDRGTVALDGCNHLNRAYRIQNLSGIADSLVTHLFDLSTQQAQDSVYFSFYSPCGGLSDRPEVGDSLMVFFRDTTQGRVNWIRVWASPGALKADTFFHAAIHVGDSRFLHDSFQVMFRNRASLTGYYDLWLLDYIRLDRNRTAEDYRARNDVGLQSIRGRIFPPYTLTTYQQVVDTLTDSIRIYFRNLNFTQQAAVTYRLDLEDVLSPGPLTAQAPSSTAAAGKSDTIYLNPFPDYQPNKRSAYEVSLIRQGAPDADFTNDTLRRAYRVDSLIGYDDGNFESGYGMTGPRGFGVRLRLRNPDTLAGVWMSFMPAFNVTNGKGFQFAIWKDPQPDSLLFSQFVGMFLEYGPYPGYYQRFRLDSLIPLEADRDYWIGLRQTDANSINIGLDLTDGIAGEHYRDSVGFWRRSQIPGNLMIRGELLSGKFTRSTASRDGYSQVFHPLKLWPVPNPGTELNLQWPESVPGPGTLELLTTDGRLVLRTEWLYQPVTQLSLPAGLSEGLYLLRAEHRGQRYTGRVLVRR